jgi:molybdopterin-containing oxidoreductase family iron-sulfur binding subunit
VTPAAQIDKADVIMALDCDFLGVDGGLLETRQFTARRKVDGPDAQMNRLYVVENRYTVTGGMADHRLRLPASQVGAFAVALAEAIGGAAAPALAAVAKELPRSAAKIMPEWVKEAAADLVASKGKALVMAGPGSLPRFTLWSLESTPHSVQSAPL